MELESGRYQLESREVTFCLKDHLAWEKSMGAEVAAIESRQEIIAAGIAEE